jgi:hypothetical protein
MRGLENEETQRHGIALVVYNIGLKDMSSMHIDLMMISGFLFTDLPAQLVSVHYCYNTVKLRLAIAVFQTSLGRAGRIRFRAHYGKSMPLFLTPKRKV